MDIEAYGRATSEWLPGFLPLPQGMPAHDTWARVFARLKPEAFRTGLLAGLTAVQERRGGPLARGPRPLVSAWATAAHGVLGQVAVAQKSHELTASPPCLQLLALSGGVVTIDARGTPNEMAKPMRAPEADDVLALQGHPGTLHEDVALVLEWADAHQDRDVVHQTDETHHTGHGRAARRRTTVPTDLTGWRSVAMVEAWRTQGDVGSYERRYDLSSLGLDATQRAASVRGHWAMEQALPWVLDIAFREDDRRIRQGHAPEHFAMLRHIALNVLKQEKTNRHGMKGKSNRAGWAHDYFLTVLGM